MANTQLGELLKLPKLLQHYISHKNETPEINFWQFLNMHYNNGNPKDADYDEDMKLPFKTVNLNYSAFDYCTENVLEFNFKKKNKELIVSNFFPRKNLMYTSNCLSAIWQPPKA